MSQTSLFDFGIENIPQIADKVDHVIAKEKLTVSVEAEWIASTSQYAKSGYVGGWKITKSPKGHPQINGGYGSPDFGNETVSDIINHIKCGHTWILENYDLIVKVTVTRDDRIKQILDDVNES